jgi:outer membrane protein assembly factor BamD
MSFQRLQRVRKLAKLLKNARILTTTALLPLLLASCATDNPDEQYLKMDAKQIYVQGSHNLKQEKYHLAIKDFQGLERKYPYGEYTDKAQLAEIYTLYKQDEFEEATKACERFIRLHPRHPNVAYAYYMRGVIGYAENYTLAFRLFPIDRSKRESAKSRETFAAFKLLVDKFPESRYAFDAKQRMLKLKEQIARLEYHIANDYYKSKIFVAAANRASAVVSEFPDTCVARDALRLLVKIYDTLGQKELANETRQILKDNQTTKN